MQNFFFKFFFYLLVHTYSYISSKLFPSFLSFYLPTALYFIVTLPSFFLCFDSSFSHFILYRFDIIFLIQSIFFPHKTVSILSLSLSLSLLSFGGFLLFLITLIKVNGSFFLFFFNMYFGIVCVCVCVCVCFFFFFNFPLESLLFPFYSFD